ncbi:MAG: acyl-ACP thioesterase [Treponema sp.]|jgi:acyl-ACP thioesterase|nr:acyl-ACP thioesterase [Treponema sp.]
MIPIWQENITARFADVDHSNRLTLAAAFDYFQEASIKHAGSLGVGIEAMKQTGVAWILSRITVRIERRPHYGDKLTVQTWPRGAEKLFAVRDCAILDENDAILAQARSNWLIVDLEKRRPLRPHLTMERLPVNEGLDMVSERIINLEPREGMTKTGERRALYSDIDYYGHVNNARYAQWIQDSVEPELLEQAETLRLDIMYLQEIKLGETIELWRLPLQTPLTLMPETEAREVQRCEQATMTPAFAFEGRRNRSDAASLKQETVFRAELSLRSTGCAD